MRHGVGRDDAAVAHEPRVNPAAAVGDLAQVERPVFGCGNFHLQARRAFFSHAHRFAGGQHNVTAGRADHTLIVDGGPDQHHTAAGCRRDVALVDDGCGKCAIGRKAHAAGKKIFVRDIQRGSDEACNVHSRVGAEEHAVRIDEEHAAV